MFFRKKLKKNQQIYDSFAFDFQAPKEKKFFF